jgi:hypothetical protein
VPPESSLVITATRRWSGDATRNISDRFPEHAIKSSAIKVTITIEVLRRIMLGERPSSIPRELATNHLTRENLTREMNSNPRAQGIWNSLVF